MDSHLRGNDMQRHNSAIRDHFGEWLYVFSALHWWGFCDPFFLGGMICPGISRTR